MNILWTRNCRAYREPMTSHELVGLAGSRQMLLHMWQRAAGRRQGYHLESIYIILYHIKNPTLSIDVYLLEEQSCQISSQSDLKRRSLRPFWKES